jgi:hypothetical protein
MTNGRRFEAIPVKYRGVQYRSILEAHWALFLDFMRVEHTYEPQSFIIALAAALARADQAERQAAGLVEALRNTPHVKLETIEGRSYATCLFCQRTTLGTIGHRDDCLMTLLASFPAPPDQAPAAALALEAENAAARAALAMWVDDLPEVLSLWSDSMKKAWEMTKPILGLEDYDEDADADTV